MTQIINHADRDHALLSASSAHRWLECTASARYEDTLPDNAGPAAKLGSLAHEAAEARASLEYTRGYGPKTYENRIEELKRDDLWIDDIDGWTKTYVKKLTEITEQFDHFHIALEQRVEYDHIAPEGFGTADAIIVAEGTLYLRDFKTGRNPNNRVPAEDNPQLILYALAAYERYRMIYHIQRVNFGIIQPTLDHFPEAQLEVEDLIEQGERIKPIAQEAFEGPGTFKPGDHCQFCRARAICRARAETEVKNIFKAEAEPSSLSNEEIGRYLTDGRNLAKWLKDLEQHALNESLAGRPVAGYKAIQTQGNRRWTDQDAAFKRLTEEMEIDEALLYERKAATLAQIERTIGKPAFKQLEDLVERPLRKPTLVPDTDKRAAVVNPTAAEVFESEED